jgi:hypothetical protein
MPTQLLTALQALYHAKTTSLTASSALPRQRAARRQVLPSRPRSWSASDPRRTSSTSRASNSSRRRTTYTSGRRPGSSIGLVASAQRRVAHSQAFSGARCTSARGLLTRAFSDARARHTRRTARSPTATPRGAVLRTRRIRTARCPARCSQTGNLGNCSPTQGERDVLVELAFQCLPRHTRVA